MSLETGKRLHSNNWIEVPISDDVIRRVNELGLQEGQTDMRRDGPVFEWGPNEPMEDEEHDDEQLWNDDNDDDHDHNDDANDEPMNHAINQDAVHIEDDTETPTDDVHEQNNNMEPEECEEYAPTKNQKRDPIDEETINDDKSVETRSAQDHDEHDNHTEETDDTNDANKDHNTPSGGVNVGGYNLRGN